MGDTELIAIIEKAVQDAIKTELGAYKVDKEQHYQDHLWLKELRVWFQEMQKSFWKSLVGIILLGIFTLLILGFIFWAKINILTGVAK